MRSRRLPLVGLGGAKGVLGFETRPAHMIIPELNSLRRTFKIHEALDRARFSTRDIEKIMGRQLHSCAHGHSEMKTCAFFP